MLLHSLGRTFSNAALLLSHRSISKSSGRQITKVMKVMTGLFHINLQDHHNFNINNQFKDIHNRCCTSHVFHSPWGHKYLERFRVELERFRARVMDPKVMPQEAMSIILLGLKDLQVHSHVYTYTMVK